MLRRSVLRRPVCRRSLPLLSIGRSDRSLGRANAERCWGAILARLRDALARTPHLLPGLGAVDGIQVIAVQSTYRFLPWEGERSVRRNTRTEETMPR